MSTIGDRSQSGQIHLAFMISRANKAIKSNNLIFFLSRPELQKALRGYSVGSNLVKTRSKVAIFEVLKISILREYEVVNQFFRSNT